MCSLERTRAGRFALSDAVTLEEIQEARNEDRHMELLRPVDTLFSQYPSLVLAEKDVRRCKNGTDIPNMEYPEGQYRVYGPEGEFLMLGKIQNGNLGTVKSFFEVSKG